MEEAGSDGVLLNGFALNVRGLESLELPRWRLSIGWDRWLELRWLERVSERVSPKTGVLPSWSGMVYGTGPLLIFLSSSRIASNIFLSG
jgi:hypothetical protein